MNVPLYTIQTIAKGPGGALQYLDADDRGNVTIQNSAAETSQWAICYDPDSQAVLIINASSSGRLTGMGDGNPVQALPPGSITTDNTWNFSAVTPGAQISVASNSIL